jgi:hypothetical protein
VTVVVLEKVDETTTKYLTVELVSLIRVPGVKIAVVSVAVVKVVAVANVNGVPLASVHPSVLPPPLEPELREEVGESATARNLLCYAEGRKAAFPPVVKQFAFMGS